MCFTKSKFIKSMESWVTPEIEEIEQKILAKRKGRGG